MELAWIVYFINTLDNLKSVCLIIVFLSLTIGLIMVTFYPVICDVIKLVTFKTIIKYNAIVLCIAVSVLILAPSRKTSYTMLAAYVGQKALEHKISPKLMQVIEYEIGETVNEANDKTTD